MELSLERKISNKGSVTIPSAMRREIGIDGNEKVDLCVLDDGNILIKRIAGKCVFCGDNEHVRAFKGRFVCDNCMDDLGGVGND